MIRANGIAYLWLDSLQVARMPDVINADHALVKRLHDEPDGDRFTDWTRILYEQAVLAEGGELADPYAFVSRLNKMLSELSGAGESGRIIT